MGDLESPVSSIYAPDVRIDSIRRGNLEEVKRLNNKQLADFNEPSEVGEFPITIAFQRGNLKIVQDLLESGKLNRTNFFCAFCYTGAWPKDHEEEGSNLR